MAKLKSFRDLQQQKKITDEEHDLDLADMQECLLQKQIIENATLKSQSDKNAFTENPLRGHEITKEYRTKMMDWMVEVCTSFKCNKRAYFLATQIFDQYASQCHQKQFKALTNKDVHSIGITSMYLASKYEDIYPLHSKIVSDKIAHKAISGREILRKEEEFLRLFDFQIDFITHFDYYEVYDDLLQRKVKATATKASSSEVDKMFKMITTMAMFFVKMCIQNIEFSKYLPSVVNIAAFKAAVDAFKVSKSSSHMPREEICEILSNEIKQVVATERQMITGFTTDFHFKLVMESYSQKQNRPYNEYLTSAKMQISDSKIQEVSSEIL